MPTIQTLGSLLQHADIVIYVNGWPANDQASRLFHSIPFHSTLYCFILLYFSPFHLLHDTNKVAATLPTCNFQNFFRVQLPDVLLCCGRAETVFQSEIDLKITVSVVYDDILCGLPLIV